MFIDNGGRTSGSGGGNDDSCRRNKNFFIEFAKTKKHIKTGEIHTINGNHTQFFFPGTDFFEEKGLLEFWKVWGDFFVMFSVSFAKAVQIWMERKRWNRKHVFGVANFNSAI